MILVMVATFFGGAYYCGWICPFGTLQDIISKIGKKLGIKKYSMPKAIHKYLVFLRYVMAAIFFVGTMDILFEIISYDPRSNVVNFLGGTALTTGAIIVLVSFSLIALFFERPFCNYLCIEGAKYGLISSLRIFTIKRNEESCIGCKLCDKACPMNIEVSKSHQLRSPQCINCFECVDSCPVKNTLTYGKISLTPQVRRHTTLVAVTLIIGLSLTMLYSMIFAKDLFGFGTDVSNINATEIVEESTIVEEVDLTEELAGEAETTEESTESTQDTSTETRTEATNEAATDAATDASTDTSTENTTIATTEAASETATESSTAESTATSTETSTENTTVAATETPAVTESTPATETVTETVTEVTLTEAEIESLGEFAGIEDGVYSGVGYGFRGAITVEVTFKNETITKVEVVEHREDRKWFTRANNTIPDSIVEAQSTEVDTVSGATFSSIGIIDGAQAAIDSARK